MMSEPTSPAPRRRASVLSWVLGYGCLLTSLGTLLGVIVGFAILVSVGVSSAVQHVVGVMLLIISPLAAVAALGFLGLRRDSRRAARAPRQQLAVYLTPQGHGFDVAGTIASAPTSLAPLSHRPCVLWFIALQHYQAVDEGPYTADWVTFWSHSHTPDVEIRYDRTLTIDSRQNALKNGQPSVTDAPGGTITIPGGIFHMTLMPADRQQMLIFPPTTAHLQIMDTEGLPAKLHEASAALPDSWRIVEFCLTTGDFVRGYQQLTIETEPWLPDPTAPVEMSTLSQEQINAFAGGCLARVFLVGTLVLLVLGFLLLQR